MKPYTIRFVSFLATEILWRAVKWFYTLPIEGEAAVAKYFAVMVCFMVMLYAMVWLFFTNDRGELQ